LPYSLRFNNFPSALILFIIRFFLLFIIEWIENAFCEWIRDLIPLIFAVIAIRVEKALRSELGCSGR